ncbi:MAG: hypothetical protein R6U17_06430 [Thermoplasmata archaeon]
MVEKKDLLNAVTYIPRSMRGEVNKKRESVPFLVSISFLVSFISARLWTVLLNTVQRPPEGVVYVGRNVVIGGYHVHHIAYGITLICISAWLAINYWSNTIVRISSITFGAGLGLIVDELGFIIGGIEPYRADQEVFYVAVLIVAGFLSLVYFPSFYDSMKRDIKRWHRTVFSKNKDEK